MLYCEAVSEVFLGPFCFIDKVIEIRKNESITALYRLKGSEEFLQDHFEGFPVMPGVLLLEALKQAASRLLEDSEPGNRNFRLVSAEDIKFGQFVKPGTELRIEARLVRRDGSARFFEGRIDLGGTSEQAGRRRAITANLVLEPASH